jgi:hypothetical protein
MAMRMTARLNMGIGPSTDGKVIFLHDEILLWQGEVG